jgi:hypothetical protein
MAQVKHVNVKVIKEYSELGVPKSVIARKLGIARNTVYYHLKGRGAKKSS